MKSLNALCVLFSMVCGTPRFFLFLFFFSLALTRAAARFEPSAGLFMTTVGEICWSHLQRASVTPPHSVTLGKKALNQSVESAQYVCLTSPCSCHQWPGAGRHVSLPYPPVSYHSFICPQGMAALPKTTTHACSRRAFLFISTPTEKIRHPKLFPYSSCFIHARIWYLSSPHIFKLTSNHVVFCIKLKEIVKKKFFIEKKKSLYLLHIVSQTAKKLM